MKTQSQVITAQAPSRRNTALAIYSVAMTTFLAAYTIVMIATQY